MSWTIYKLSELCDVFTDGDWIESKDQSPEGIRLLQTGNIGIGVFKERIDKARYVSEETFKRLNCEEVFEGDLLISRLPEPVGRGCLIPNITGRAITAVDCTILRVKSDLLDKRYLEYFIQSQPYQSEIQSKVTGTTRQRISRKNLGEIPIVFPPLSVQKQIVEKLDAAFADIDKAIIATEKNIENAEALFQKAINESQGELVALDELVTIKTGKLNSNAAVENGQYPFFTCSRKIFSINEFAFDCEALLLAGNNASGDFNVKHYQGKFNAYQRTYVITINDSKKVLYKHLYFQLLNSLASFKKMSVGANTKFLKLGMIKTLKVHLPTLAEQQNHISHIEIIQENKEKLKDIYLSKLRLLEALKSSILNQAFSGELTKDAA